MVVVLRRRWWALLGGLLLVGCGGAVVSPTSAPWFTPTPLMVPTPMLLTPQVLALPTATAEGQMCGHFLPVCWNALEQAMVAHICDQEAQGLGQAGMASCAAVVAQRQLRPDVWGGPNLEALLRPDQFAVAAARTRPWAQEISPPANALQAVQLFLTNAVEVGCWRYDSFQASTPEAARRWLAQAPAWHCVIIVEPQAMLFFNWRDG